MGLNVLSSAVSSTNTYTTKPTFNSAGGAHSSEFTYVYVFTGTMTGSLFVEGSNSPKDLIDQDIGGTNLTDKARWVVYDEHLAAGTSIAISGAVADSILLAFASYDAVRLRYVNATNSGTIDVVVSVRRGS